MTYESLNDTARLLTWRMGLQHCVLTRRPSSTAAAAEATAQALLAPVVDFKKDLMCKGLLKLAAEGNAAMQELMGVDKGIWAGQKATPKQFAAICNWLFETATPDMIGYNKLVVRSRILMGCGTGVRPGQGGLLRLCELYNYEMDFIGPRMAPSTSFCQIRNNGKTNAHGNQEHMGCLPHMMPDLDAEMSVSLVFLLRCVLNLVPPILLLICWPM